MILVLTSSLSCPNYLNTNFESVYPITVVLRQLLQGFQAASRGSSLAPALPLKPAMPRLRSQSLLLLHGSGNKVSTRSKQWRSLLYSQACRCWFLCLLAFSYQSLRTPAPKWRGPCRLFGLNHSSGLYRKLPHPYHRPSAGYHPLPHHFPRVRRSYLLLPVHCHWLWLRYRRLRRRYRRMSPRCRLPPVICRRQLLLCRQLLENCRPLPLRYRKPLPLYHLPLGHLLCATRRRIEPLVPDLPLPAGSFISNSPPWERPCEWAKFLLKKI